MLWMAKHQKLERSTYDVIKIKTPKIVQCQRIQHS